MTSQPGTQNQADTKTGVIRWIIVHTGFLLLVGLSLFLSAGTIAWPAGWGYFILAVVIHVLDAVVLIPISPDLLAERSRYQADAKKWDQFLSRIMAVIGPLVIWIVSGLDFRYGWSQNFPIWVVILSAVLVFSGGMIALWAMAINRYFIGMVRIQEERGHTVITSGPYQYVRHPGYSGALLYLYFTPLMLGSIWGLIPALITIGVVFLRTYLEDQVLQKELPGYLEYTRDVNHKLIPGIW